MENVKELNNVLVLGSEKEELAFADKPVRLEDLYKQSTDIQRLCKDVHISTKFLYINGDIVATSRTGAVRNPFSDHAFSQLCAKLGVPVRYMKKCIEKGELPLVQDNLNTWLNKEDKDLLIRIYDDRIRGVLSSRYSVLDTPDIITSLHGVVNTDEFEVKNYFLNEERFHARLVNKEPMKVNGEDLFSGLQIDSSDVGRNNLTVQFLVYKQVCTNGLILPKLNGTVFQQKHIGITTQEFSNRLREGLEVVPELIAQAEEVITKNKGTKSYSKKDFEDLLSRIKDQTLLSKDSITKLEEIVKTKYDFNRWGVINGITEIAQDFTLDRRLELERYAGSLLIA